MNQTATTDGASGASLIPSTTDAFTIAHLAVLAIFAIAVIAAIVWGMRLKRERKVAERDIASHNAEVESAAADSEVAAPEPASPPPVAVAPAPVPIDAPTQATAEPLADEPIAATAPLQAAPAAEASPEPVAPTVVTPPAEPAPAPAQAASAADAPVSTLKGLGPKLASRLGELGITTVGQVAALSDDEAARLDAQLGPFSGRITRDRWIEQARFLAAGDRAGFEAVFGRL